MEKGREVTTGYAVAPLTSTWLPTAKEASSRRNLVKAKSKLTYDPRMSYVPRDNEDIAVPVWELSETDLSDLRQRYIIAEDMNRDVVMDKIRKIMHPIVSSVLAGEDFTFMIPYNEKQHMQYQDNLCFPLLKRDDKNGVNRSFHNRNCTRTATMTAWILKAIFQNLCAEMVIAMTLRDLFYRRSVLFCSQDGSDGIVKDICLMIGCTRMSLGLISEDKGSICGLMSIKLTNGKELDCSDGAQIPAANMVDSFVSTVEDFSCIVVLEKGTMYEYLKNHRFHVKQKCLLVTANGMPDTTTRKFLKLLQQRTELPFIGLADPDPYGLSIVTCYAQGSVNLGHENFNLAIPSLIWVGISLQDIEECGIELHKYNSKPLTDTEKKTLGNTLKDKYTKLSPQWKACIERQLGLELKASFEIMHEKSYAYVADTFLPGKIRSVLGLEVDKNLQGSTEDAKRL